MCFCRRSLNGVGMDILMYALVLPTSTGGVSVQCGIARLALLRYLGAC